MGRDKRKWFTGVFVTVTVVVVALMMFATLRRPERIALPSVEMTSGEVSGEMTGAESLTLVEVMPETVQAAIATLTRPVEYQRTVMVERFWEGGSHSTQSAVAVSGEWTRVDRTLPNGQVRHAVTDGETTYIWYDQESSIRQVAAGTISADDEQLIPTYEDVLELDAAAIVAADYRIVSERQCIYVETEVDDDGYVSRFWVDLNSGLLSMAETLQHNEVVYRMAAIQDEPLVESVLQFTLPDGTFLLEN